jgi:hypothetical protein
VAWFMHNFNKMGPVEYAEIQRSWNDYRYWNDCLHSNHIIIQL